MNGSYTMSVNRAKKEMNIKIIGNFTPEQAQKFITEYNNNVKTIDASEYVLRLDCLELGVVTQDLIPALKDCYLLYKSSGFKTVVFEVVSSIVKMQLNRIAREVQLTNAEFEVKQ